MINPIGIPSTAGLGLAPGAYKSVPNLTKPIRPVGEQLSSVLDPSVKISKRINASKDAAAAHTGLINDALTRLDAGANRFRSGTQVAATTTHFSSAEAHGVTDPGQDLGTTGGPLQLVEQVLGQMSQLGGGSVQAQASQLPGM